METLSKHPGRKLRKVESPNGIESGQECQAAKVCFSKYIGAKEKTTENAGRLINKTGDLLTQGRKRLWYKISSLAQFLLARPVFRNSRLQRPGLEKAEQDLISAWKYLKAQHTEDRDRLFQP